MHVRDSVDGSRVDLLANNTIIVRALTNWRRDIFSIGFCVFFAAAVCGWWFAELWDVTVAEVGVLLALATPMAVVGAMAIFVQATVERWKVNASTRWTLRARDGVVLVERHRGERSEHHEFGGAELNAVSTSALEAGGCVVLVLQGSRKLYIGANLSRLEQKLLIDAIYRLARVSDSVDQETDHPAADAHPLQT